MQHRRDFGLGSFVDVGLADARERALKLRKQVAEHIDPLAEKAAARAQAASERAAAITVTGAVTQFVDDMKGKWSKDPKGVSKRLAMLHTYITPIIGNLSVERRGGKPHREGAAAGLGIEPSNGGALAQNVPQSVISSLRLSSRSPRQYAASV